MNFFKRIKSNPSQFALLATAIIIIIHVIGLFFYAYEHDVNEHTAGRDLVLQKVMNVIRVAKETSDASLPDAIAAFEDVDMKVSLTKTPQFSTQVLQLSFWPIHRVIPMDAYDVQLSLLLRENTWINIDADILRTPADEFFIIGLEVLIAFILLFYAWSINRFTKPLEHFRIAAERLGVDIHTETDFSHQTKGPSVVRETAEAMAQMQQRIKDLLDDRTNMIAAISHDLRTPITRMQLRNEKIDNDDIRQKNARDLNDMETMISEILSFARGDYESEEKIKLDFGSFLQSICDDFQDMGFSVDFTPPDKRIIFSARPVTLKRAIANLIENAVKYGQSAKVSLIKEHHKIKVTIVDEGPGIPEDQLELVFNPFHRIDNSRSREVGGTGLGMAIARDAILAHQGTIKLQNLPEGGLKVTVVFKS